MPAAVLTQCSQQHPVTENAASAACKANCEACQQKEARTLVAAPAGRTYSGSFGTTYTVWQLGSLSGKQCILKQSGRYDDSCMEVLAYLQPVLADKDSLSSGR